MTTRVLPFDSPAAEYHGTFGALVKKRERDPRTRRTELQIAATAASNGLMVLTRNAKDSTGLESALRVVDLS